MTALGIRARLLSLVLAVLPSLAFAGGFHAVASQDGLIAWAAGDQGILLRSANGGQDWSEIDLGAGTLHGLAVRGGEALAVGEGGGVWRSHAGGTSWSHAAVPGAGALRGIAMVSDLRGWVVGDGGVIATTMDGGDTWTLQSSGTTARLDAVRFVDASTGWAVGEHGIVLATADGGAHWSPDATLDAGELFDVDARGSEVWVVGERGLAMRSPDGGAHWSPIDLRLDYGAPVRAVRLTPDGAVWLAGGGGFLRKSMDGGLTWTYPVHPMHGAITGLALAGGSAFAVSDRHRVPIASIDGGASWALPAGATLARAWQPKLSVQANVRGHTLAVDGADPDVLYCALGNAIYRSRDAGDTWEVLATVPQASRINALLVSPRNPAVMVVAAAGLNPRALLRTEDGGQTWSKVLEHDFGEYAKPLACDRAHPDSIYFGGSVDGLWRSLDGGQTWAGWTQGMAFRGVDAMTVVPDSANVIVVADGVTGSGNAQYWKSTDWGEHFDLKSARPAGASMIPALAGSRLRNHVVFGTNWGSGGVQRSADYGESWPTVASTGATYGVTIAADDPNLVAYGTYSGGLSYLSVDGGDAFEGLALPGSNYSLLARDRETILAVQSGGVYKLAFTYTYTPLAVLDVPRTPAPELALRQNRPNPFSTATAIEYRLPAAIAVDLALFDVAGHRVRTLARGLEAAGPHALTLDPAAPDRFGGSAAPLPAGVYFYRLRAGAFSATRRMLLLR